MKRSVIKVLPILLGFSLLLGGCAFNPENILDKVLELIPKRTAQIDFGENSSKNQSARLDVYEFDEEEVPDGLYSEVYEIEFDSDYDEPVTIKIPISKEVESEEETYMSLLGIGTEVYFEDGSMETVYQYAEAKIENGYAIASFIPQDYLNGTYVHGNSKSGSSSGEPSKEKLRLGIFWCSTTFEDGGHFIVYFPAQAHKLFIPYNEREELLNDLEEIYDQYLQKGYTYSERSDWPITVNIKNISEEGYYSYGFDGAGGSITINKKFFTDSYQSSSVKPLLAHEFFHFVQLNYETTSTDNLWFDEATATYFESKELGNTPSIVSEYKEKIFTGVIPEDNTAANGYARMPLISYLSNKLQEDFIRNAYETVKEGAEWDSALLSSMGPAQNWAGDFYKELVSGNVGDYSPYTLFKNISSGEMAEIGTTLALKLPNEEESLEAQENGEVPILGKTSLSIDAYGAKLIAITIDEDNIKLLSEDSNPTISVSGNAAVSVFVIKGKNFETLNSIAGEVEVPDFLKAVNDKKVILVLITALHESGKQDYEVTVQMPRFPTLDELVGSYIDGTMFFKEVTVSDELKAQTAAENDENEDEFCDLDALALIEAMEGQTKPTTILITKTGENTGNLALLEEGEEGDASTEMETIPFTYINGQIICDYELEGTALNGILKASYGKEKNVLINGSIIMKMGEDLSIEFELHGSKPLLGE